MFTHDTAVRSGTVDRKVHDLLDPKRPNKAGLVIRESLDSDTCPNSVPVAVLFDVTGSMRQVPQTFVLKLNTLMATLVKKGFLKDPHVLFGAIGDATCDDFPLQIGQFETGNEMDDVLSKIILEGGGGGQNTESYELGMYYLARKSKLDSVDKRGKKGYCFIIGDELPYDSINKNEVSSVIGDTLEANIPTKDILEELRAKFEVFWIIPNQTSNFRSASVVDPLKKMFGQNFLKLENPDNICELIVTTIGFGEGFDADEVKTALTSVGVDIATINASMTALSAYKPVGGKVAKVVGGKALVPSGKDDVDRL